MHTDTVLDRDSYPIFEGTRQETKEWLQEHPKRIEDGVVVIGVSTEMISIKDYLSSIDE